MEKKEISRLPGITPKFQHQQAGNNKTNVCAHHRAQTLGCLDLKLRVITCSALVAPLVGYSMYYDVLITHSALQ